MKILICGMSGFVGHALQDHFKAAGHEVVGIRVRQETQLEDLTHALESGDVLINLSGANILTRWSESYKQELYHSRIDTTRKLVKAMAACKTPPKTMLSTSAVGIYDSIHRHNDDSQNLAADFLGSLCVDWEIEARKAEVYGARVCTMRFGVVFGKGGGAITKMLLPFKLGLGGKLGSGQQKVSWIHIDDLVGAMDHLITHEELAGAFNFTAPGIVRNIEQTCLLAQALNRPAPFTIPEFAIRLLFGEGATVVLDSKAVYPERLIESGYVFKYPHLGSAFREIVSDGREYASWSSAMQRCGMPHPV